MDSLYLRFDKMGSTNWRFQGVPLPVLSLIGIKEETHGLFFYDALG